MSMIGRPECENHGIMTICFPEVRVRRRHYSRGGKRVLKGVCGWGGAAAVGCKNKNKNSKVVEKNKPQKNIITTTVLYIWPTKLSAFFFF